MGTALARLRRFRSRTGPAPQDGAARSPDGPAARPPDRHHRAIAVVAAVAVAGVFGYEFQWLGPHIAEARDRLSHPSLAWVGIAVWAEMGSLVAFARLRRTLLRAGGVRVRLRGAIALTFAANAMSVNLPGGSVISTAYTYRRMRSWGASAPLVAFGLTASGVLSTLTLGLLGLIGASIAGRHPSPIVLIAELLVTAAAVLTMRRLVERPDLLLRLTMRGLARINRLRRRPPATGQDRVQELFAELALIRPSGWRWVRSTTFAALNWILDLVCLVACCRAVGISGSLLGVALVSYAAGMAAAGVPLLPGGIGIVDGALILGLTHGGFRVGPATAGVVLYRLVSLVLVSLIGWLVWWQAVRAARSNATETTGA